MVLADLHRKDPNQCGFHLSLPTELWGIWGCSSLLKGQYPDSWCSLPHDFSGTARTAYFIRSHWITTYLANIFTCFLSAAVAEAIAVRGTNFTYRSNSVLSSYTPSSAVLWPQEFWEIPKWNIVQGRNYSEYLNFYISSTKWIWGYRQTSKYIPTIILWPDLNHCIQQIKISVSR